MDAKTFYGSGYDIKNHGFPADNPWREAVKLIALFRRKKKARWAVVCDSA